MTTELGIAEVQYNLGQMYQMGQGVPQDNAEAVKWYRKAAEQGFAPAQLNLGMMYAAGKGVSEDKAEAAKWCLEAARQGNTEAQMRIVLIIIVFTLMAGFFWTHSAPAPD